MLTGCPAGLNGQLGRPVWIVITAALSAWEANAVVGVNGPLS
jgi:hypothetical protein